MRKLLLAVAVLSISLFACKKDTAPKNENPPATNGEKFAVSFSCSDFLQKMEPLPTGRKVATGDNLRDSVLAGKVSHLYYVFYNEAGQYLKTTHQNAADSDFGTLVDSLPANRYMMALVASTDPVQLIDTSYFYNLRIRLPDATIPYQNVSAPDVFITNTGFIVNGYGPTQIVYLQPGRIMGRLELNILDAPEVSGPNDTSIVVYTSPAFRIYSLYGYLDEMIPDPGIVLQRNSRTNFSTQLLSPNNEISVKIAYSDKNTGERKIREMRYVPYARGYRTLMSGNVYTSTGGGTGFSISLDTTWYNFAEIPF